MFELQTVIFRLNDQLCGVDASQVSEIRKYQNVARMPKLPKFVKGIINLRGLVVPVVDLNERFEIGETEIKKETKIIITQVKNKYVGFIVNDVFEISKFTDEDLELPPETIYQSGNSYVKHIAKEDNKLITILDMEKVLTDNEVKRISNKKKN